MYVRIYKNAMHSEDHCEKVSAIKLKYYKNNVTLFLMVDAIPVSLGDVDESGDFQDQGTYPKQH